MKKFTAILFMLSLWAGSSSNAQQVTLPRTPSPQAEVSQTIGISKVIIDYSRPAVRDREIWGTPLAHYGYINQGFGAGNNAPWRAGANENSTITFSDNAKVEGKDIPAGTYGMFMAIYDDGKVDVVFSTNSTSWGSYFYDPAEDQLRVTVNSVEHAPTERLTYSFIDIDKSSATCVLDWEKKRIPFKISFDVDKIVLANASNELRNSTGFGWQGPASAAQYALGNNVELEQALKWADQSIATQSNFNNLMLKSQILTALNRNDEAKGVADKALADPATTVQNYYSYGRQLINADKDIEAMEVFMTLSKKWPKHWLAPHGLARAYSAAGDYKRALKYEREALTKCPDGSKQFLEGFITQLEKGEDFN